MSDRISVPEPNGLIAHCAATMRARFGYWPQDFVDLVKRFHGGKIPGHVQRLCAEKERTRPWERCAHGVDLTAPFPFCEECSA